MSDLAPNLRVSRQRLRMTIAGLEHNVERQRLEILEMTERIEKNEENIAATLAAIAAEKDKLAGMERPAGSSS